MTSNNHLVIMAGGIGSRFWPVSTKDYPKQFIDILGNGQSLIQETVSRFKDICPPENIWIVSSKDYKSIIAKQLPEIPVDNILLEPCRRNTAPCIAYATWKILQRTPEANIIVTPSDHHITDVTEFRRIISSALEFVADNDTILTIGIKPSRPDTGYGYIEAAPDSISKTNKEIYKVNSFKEKPDLETAKEYITKNNFMWNSGIFVWNIRTIVSAISRYEPQIAETFEKIKISFGTDEEVSVIDEYFPQCKNISIDYAVLEHAENVYVFPADFGWNDLGTWKSLYDFLEHDVNGNASIGNNITISESSDNIIHTIQEKDVILIGIKNCIIAEYNGKLLICDKNEEELIKKITNRY